MKALLVLFVWVHSGTDGGVAVKVETIPFETMAQCQAAAPALTFRREPKSSFYIGIIEARAVCVERTAAFK